jgi:hypothetical protein
LRGQCFLDGHGVVVVTVGAVNVVLEEGCGSYRYASYYAAYEGGGHGEERYC